PHVLRRGAFSTGGGAFRWPSGSTLDRIDGPPSFRAVHSPLLTGGPATGDSTDSPERSQHSRVGATGRTRLTRGTELDGVPMDVGSQKEEDKRWTEGTTTWTASAPSTRRSCCGISLICEMAPTAAPGPGGTTNASSRQPSYCSIRTPGSHSTR